MADEPSMILTAALVHGLGMQGHPTPPSSNQL